MRPLNIRQRTVGIASILVGVLALMVSGLHGGLHSASLVGMIVGVLVGGALCVWRGGRCRRP